MIYLVITPFFPDPESFRGPYVYDQVRAIQATGKYDVVVLKPTSCYHPEKDYEYDGIRVFRFPEYELPSAAWPGALNTLSLRSFSKCLQRLGISYEQIGIVHAHITRNALYANQVKSRNPHVKTILQHHGFDVLGLTDGRFANFGWHKRLTTRYGVELCNDIDLHVGVSRATLDCLKTCPGIQIRESFVLYNGVDTEKFHPTGAAKLPGIFHIGCIANFWKIKDQITLIKAVELLIRDGRSNIRVTFIGSGYTLQSCKDYIREHELDAYFSFRTEVDHRQLPAFYNSLDLFVLPSYWDAFGCVYTEAYACGVPFMACRASGIAEYIPAAEADKWLIDAQDHEHLADNIRKYIDHPVKQNLSYPIEIKTLIADFLDYI